MKTPFTTSLVAGYPLDEAANLSDPEERVRLSSSGIKAFVTIAGRWGLNEMQSRGLLGGVASSTFHTWKSSPEDKRLDQDTLMRISLVVGIYKALNIYFGKPWADRWVTLENRGRLFAGGAPIDYMIRHGQPGIVEVRRLVDAWRGGQ
ncbi:MAG: MbcA/ParS/Xre antitoxin family protein [Terracidiphilus sp.]|jgi:hypothetical protein